MSGIGKTHNKFESCEGCPHGCADSNCHTTCAGYQYRTKKNDKRREQIKAGKQKRDRKVYRGADK